MRKYYCVKVGVTPGIYGTWSVCERMVKGYSGAKYKSFPTLAEAKQFMGDMEYVIDIDEEDKEDPGREEADERNTGKRLVMQEPYAFVDGSFNAETGVYGYGGFLVADGVRHVVQGSGNDAEMASMRNVAGEILGAEEVVRLAVRLRIKELTVYYDYLGIEMWVTEKWQRNKAGTIAYHDFMKSVQKKIRIRFVKVKGHSGVDGNEEADRLAKEAVGLL